MFTYNTVIFINVTKHNGKIKNFKNMHLIVKYSFTLHFKSFSSDSHDFEVEVTSRGHCPTEAIQIV
jgi:hypothetical protein